MSDWSTAFGAVRVMVLPTLPRERHDPGLDVWSGWAVLTTPRLGQQSGMFFLTEEAAIAYAHAAETAFPRVGAEVREARWTQVYDGKRDTAMVVVRSLP